MQYGASKLRSFAAFRAGSQACGISKFAISFWFVGAEGKIDEERMLRLGRFLRISRDIGLPGALPRLERYMETESLKEQLSGPGFYYLDFGGR
jgi:hypothetical protein